MVEQKQKHQFMLNQRKQNIFTNIIIVISCIVFYNGQVKIQWQQQKTLHQKNNNNNNLVLVAQPDPQSVITTTKSK